jgi:hypothetical protein
MPEVTAVNWYVPSGPDMVVATIFSLMSNKAIDMPSSSLPFSYLSLDRGEDFAFDVSS